MRVTVIIPALNEAESIGKVLDDIPRSLVQEIIVGDNGSADGTPEIVRQRGAKVARAEKRGYGHACMAAIAVAEETDVLVFLDGDYSDHPEQLPELLAPIQAEEADLVIGSRVRGKAEAGALLPQARFGNWLATRLLRWIFGAEFTDLGPFRAIRKPVFDRLDMRELTFGWTVEMQAKAAALGIPCAEVPVDYRRRIGVSKVTGTIRGSTLAGIGILRTIGHIALFPPRG